jgi:hypothetical protein
MIKDETTNYHKPTYKFPDFNALTIRCQSFGQLIDHTKINHD